ncbi:MAG TPA: lactate racemase domain-containing protein [Polyangia bacterium]
MSSQKLLERRAKTGVLSESDIEGVIAGLVDHLALANQRVLVIIPDATRSMPLPLFFRLLGKHVLPQVKGLDYLVALGTHPAMSEEALCKLVGVTPEELARDYAGVRLLNHAWDDPNALTTLGSISEDEVAALSGGKLRMEVPVRLNRLVQEYDHLLICGPVFPHEVVGFSGGNKYFFPGIAGPDIINFTHWLAALITSYDVIGTKHTPVRKVIDRAASFIKKPKSALCSVVTHEGVAGLAAGSPEAAWEAAADLSAERHVIWCERPYQQVFSVLPAMYDELWVGAKGMYKTEPAIADGGEVIIYAPHLHEVSVVHGKLIRQIGSHVRDYFVAQWDKFKHLSWGVLAHSTHLKGKGTFENGVERARINVTLATGISEAECKSLNLGYRDWRSLDPKSFAGRESEGVLYVPKAGEYLYRVGQPQK